MREAYTQDVTAANISQQQLREVVQSLRDENEILKEMLLSHGIQYEAELDRRKAERLASYNLQQSPLAASSTTDGSQAGGQAHSTSYMQSITPATTVASGLSPRANGVYRIDVSPPVDQSQNVYGHQHQHQQHYHMGSPELPMTLDHAGGPVTLGHHADRPVPAVQGIFELDQQLQSDFILTYVTLPPLLGAKPNQDSTTNTCLFYFSNNSLESPCRAHTDYLCRRFVTEADDEDMPFSGHALMATCPPPSYIANTTAAEPYPHKMVDLPQANLTTLLNLSRQLVTEGQITPIMALQFLKNHELYPDMTREDVKAIIDTLSTKVRCYGFGACVEDFELMDCLAGVFGSRWEGFGHGHAHGYGYDVVQRVGDDMTY